MTLPNWLILCCVAMLVVVPAGATPASAQSRSQPRVEISANVGALTGASTFEGSHSFNSNGNETATLTVEHGVKTPVAFNVGGAVRIVRQMWLGVQYAVTEMKPSASISGAIPHPVLFNAPRTVEGSTNDVAHNERNLHVDVMYALPVGGVDVKIMGGPTFFNLEQDFVSAVALTETYPFDTATLASATKKQLSQSAVGFNAGVDVSYPLLSTVGVGGLIRYSSADVKFDDPAVGQQTAKAGGIEAVAGVRLRF